MLQRITIMSHLLHTSVSSVPSSVADIVEANRKEDKVELTKRVLSLKRVIAQSIGIKDVGSIALRLTQKDSQAAVVLMAQLTQDQRVVGELGTDANLIIFNLKWDLTDPTTSSK
jgi:hypothetical protein